MACLDEAQRVEHQSALVEEAAGLLGVDSNAALLLLRSAGWNLEVLLDRYMVDPASTCAKAGVFFAGTSAAGAAGTGPPSKDATAADVAAATAATPEARVRVRPAGNAVCAICRDSPEFVSSLACGHEYCTDCWGKYVSLKDTIAGFQGIVNGEYDDLPEQAFYMCGGIEDAIEKAKKMTAEAA